MKRLALSALLYVSPILALAAAENRISVDPATFDALQGKVHRANLGRTGVWDASGLKSLSGIKWTFKTGGPVRSSPVVVDGTVYVGSYDGHFYALDAADGTLKWQFKTGGKIAGSAAIAHGKVFFAGEDGVLYALSVSEGQLIWKAKLTRRGGGTAGSPAVMYGTVFIGAGSRGGSEVLLMSAGPILGFDEQTGKPVWSARSGPQGYAAISTDGKALFAGKNGSGYAAFDLRTASEMWYDSGGHQNRQFMSMTCANGLVYIPTTMRGAVMCRKPDGKKGARGRVWFAATLDGQLDIELNQGGKFGYEIFTDLAVTPTTVHCGCNDGKLHTFDAKTGEKGWTFQTGGKVQSSPSLAGGAVYFGSWDAHLYALEAASGDLLWKQKLGGRIISSSWPGDGVIYVGCDDGCVYALN